MSGLVASILEFAILAVQLAGLPALFVIFVLKGALVGKVLPTSVVLPGYVFATNATYYEAMVLVVLLTVAHMIGQLVIVGGVRWKGLAFLSSIPYVSADPDSQRYKRADEWFERYGDVALFTTNLVPWLRGMIAIPAGMVSYPVGKFTCYVGLSTLLYHAVYVGLVVAGVSLVT